MNKIITGISGDIYRSVHTLFETPEGTIVNDRGYGFNDEGVDQSPDIAEAMFMAQIEEKLARYEPRARVADIIAESDKNGITAIKVVMEYANQESASN